MYKRMLLIVDQNANNPQWLADYLGLVYATQEAHIVSFVEKAYRPSNLSQAGILFDPDNKLEEENLRGYSPKRFYPVKTGNLFHSRYRWLERLAMAGRHSTVLLCKDLQQHAYVTLKMSEHGSGRSKGEKEVYKHPRNIKSSHTRSMLVRQAIDAFHLRNRSVGKVLPEDLLKPALIHVLLAVDFLLTDAQIVHSDNNVMLSVEDEPILVEFEEAEISSPRNRKIVDERVIYASRDLGIPKLHGRPILSDFGKARFSWSLGKQWEDTQPLVFRAPEAWHLFYARDSNSNVSSSHHLAGMIAIMGSWRGTPEIPLKPLEKLEENLRHSQQSLFLCFMRKTLRWQPENRASAKELRRILG
ncbi:hypothetical protein BDW62DRAFT_219381 [Aspergillus aurantiobrunneus]